MRLAAAAFPLTLVFGFWGCEKEKPPAPRPARQQPLQPDGTTARKVTSTLDRLKVQMDLSAVRAGLRAWHSGNGTYPGSIGNLNLEGLSYPADLAYDPARGTVRSLTYPEL